MKEKNGERKDLNPDFLWLNGNRKLLWRKKPSRVGS